MNSNTFVDNVLTTFKQFLQDKKIPESTFTDEEWGSLREMICCAAPKFKGENDIDRANIIIGVLEDLLVVHNIHIPNPERDKDDDEAALIYGDDYYNLEDDILAFAKQAILN